MGNNIKFTSYSHAANIVAKIRGRWLKENLRLFDDVITEDRFGFGKGGGN
jgi:hypothetical protein